MNDTICPVIFQKIEGKSFPRIEHGRIVYSENDGKSQKQIAELRAKNKKYLDAVLSGQKPKELVKPAGKDIIFKKCKIVSGQAANEIIIKSILPDDRPQKCRSKNDRFGIPVLIDEDYKSAALLGHQKIKAITILESWHEPSTILKMTPYMTSADAWLGYYSGRCVSIELADGIILRGNIEPCLKAERETIIKLETTQKLSKAKGNVKRLKPDAEKQRKRVKNLRNIAAAGGRATARKENSGERIIAILKDYKHRFPKHKMSTALQNVITVKENHPYLNYGNIEKLRQRLKSITRTKKLVEWYRRLKGCPLPLASETAN